MSIRLAPAPASVGIGNSLQLASTGTYTDGTGKDLTAEGAWASSNTAVATVNSGGQVTSVQVGTADINATIDGVVGTTVLTVGLASIAVTPGSPSVAKGLSQLFSATGTFTNGSTGDITALCTWNSSNIGVAIFRGTGGLVTAAGQGTATIVATVNDVTSVPVTLTVSPGELVSITVTPDRPALGLSFTQQFTATGIFTDGPLDITASSIWTSADPSVAAIVSTGGLATASGVGSTNITATLGAVAGSTVLSVESASATAPLVGHLVLEGDSRTNKGYELDIAIALYTADRSPLIDAPMIVRRATLSRALGAAEFLLADVPVGTFHIAARSEQTLVRVVRSVTISASGAAVDFGSLAEGDADGNEVVNRQDYDILRSAFGTCMGDEGFDTRADFDRSGCVGLSDLGLLSINFMRGSPTETD